MKKLYLKWKADLKKLYDEREELNGKYAVGDISNTEYYVKYHKLDGKITMKLNDMAELKKESEILKTELEQIL